MDNDVILLAKELIKKKSVTPDDDGAIELLSDYLKQLGFTCNILDFKQSGYPDTRNLYACYGDSGMNLAFAGHTDVVPAGDGWQYGPFDAVIHNDTLYGRGAVDMKGAIASFIIAVKEFLESNPKFNNKISFIITGDEEDVAINGTIKILEWLKQRHEKIDHCLVGEPTNPNSVGEMIKIGRRGSINFTITSIGKQGHVAYPENAINPVSRLTKLLDFLSNHTFDKGNKFFDPTNLEITTIDVGNKTTNVIPYQATAQLNIRFNNEHDSKALIKFIKEACSEYLYKYSLEHRVSGEAFFNRDTYFTDLVSTSIENIIKKAPIQSTSGGTSDARFIKDICPVVEFGLVNKTAHRVDENIDVDELIQLKNIYKEIISNYFKS